MHFCKGHARQAIFEPWWWWCWGLGRRLSRGTRSKLRRRRYDDIRIERGIAEKGGGGRGGDVPN